MTDAAGIAEAAEYMTMQMLDMAAAVTAACLQGDTEWAKDRMGWLLSDANWVMTLQDSDECKPIPEPPYTLASARQEWAIWMATTYHTPLNTSSIYMRLRGLCGCKRLCGQCKFWKKQQDERQAAHAGTLDAFTGDAA